MLSRVAESIYWMARYIERADNVARCIVVNHHLVLDLPMGADAQWEPLIIVSGDEVPFREKYSEANKANVLRFLTFDTDNPNSILSCVTAARENARSVREIISTDMWRQVNHIYLRVLGAVNDQSVIDAPHDFFEEIRLASALFIGLTDTTMSHGEAWQFCQMGRLLERADKTTRILDVKYFILLPTVAEVGTPYDGLHWNSLLRSASAFEMYRQKHGRISPNDVVDFLLLDRHFPRSVVFCLTQANTALHDITSTPRGEYVNTAELELGALRADMAYARVQDIIAEGLHEFLDRVQERINTAGQAIHHAFFAFRGIDDSNSSSLSRRASDFPEPVLLQGLVHAGMTTDASVSQLSASVTSAVTSGGKSAKPPLETTSTATGTQTQAQPIESGESSSERHDL